MDPPRPTFVIGMAPQFDQLASRLRQADTFVSIAEVVISELELAGYHGVALLAHDGLGAPAVWAGNAHVDRPAALAYLTAGHREDLGLAEVRRTHAPAPSAAQGWSVPILGCGELIGTLKVVASEDADPAVRQAELARVGGLIAVRLALLGMEAPLALHVRSTLTGRQHQVAYLVARGCTNAEIAQMLVISANAVKKHVSRVLEVMGVSNRTELAACAGRWSPDRPEVRSLVLVDLANPLKSQRSPGSTTAA